MQYLSCTAARSAAIVQMLIVGGQVVQVWKCTAALSKCMVARSAIMLKMEISIMVVVVYARIAAVSLSCMAARLATTHRQLMVAV